MKKNKGENNFINNLLKLIILLAGLILQILIIFLLLGATATVNEYAEIIFELLKIISILMLIKENKTYKTKMVKRKKEVQSELTAMEDKIRYIETISKYKRQLTEKIRKIDIILSDKEKLLKEYEKRNKGLPLSKKIFSKKVLRSILEKEREEILLELKKCNDKLSSRKFVKVKKEYEYEYEYLKLVEYKDVDKIIEERIIFLQKRVLQSLKIKAKNAINREEINRILYELRYFLLLPIDSKTKILERKIYKKKFRQKLWKQKI